MQLQKSRETERHNAGEIMAAPDSLPYLLSAHPKRARERDQATSIDRWPLLMGLIWAGLDCASVIVAGLVAFRIRLTYTLNNWEEAVSAFPPGMLFLYLLLYTVYLVSFARSYGLYRPMDKRSGMNEQRLTIQASLTAGLLLCGTLYLLRAYAVSRIVMALTVLLTTVLLMLRRAIWRRLRQRRFIAGIETRNVLIVGAGRVGQALRSHIEALPHMGFRFKGFVSMRQNDGDNPDPLIVGNVRNCVALARTLFADEIFFSTPVDRETLLPILDEARSLGIDVRVVPDLYDGLAWNAPVEYVGQFPTIPLHQRQLPRSSYLLKRILDVSLCFLALPFTAPLMLSLALAIRFDSAGPVFYKAERLGRKGRVFQCYKFRTMVPDADRLRTELQHMNERDGVLFKIANDPRLTRIGAWLRKYSLDELPQLLNVLRGDMSLVGPRPPLAAEVKKYDLPHLRRLDVLPGMTGLWQVEARQDPSFASYISLDTAYVDHWSMGLDVRILARTVSAVLAGTGS